MDKFFHSLRDRLSKKWANTLLLACLMYIVTFAGTLDEIGAKWKDFQLSLIEGLAGGIGLILFIRREIDLAVIQVAGKLVLFLGICLMFFGLVGLIRLCSFMYGF